MARWTEEQERWMGRGDRYDEDERRFREERGEEGGWRGRDWRDEDAGRWRGGEHGEWRESGRGRFMQGEGGWRRGYGEPRRDESYGERWRAQAGRRGDDTTYGSSSGEWGYGRDEGRRGLGRGYRYGEERGRRESFGERLREGVRKLTGRGPKGYRRPDHRIHDEVCERIARSWVIAENVEVKVENGEVTLAGFVESREEKRALEDIAEDVFGVEEVHNHLRLQRAGQVAEEAQVPAGTGTTGTGAAMSARQQPPTHHTGGPQPHDTDRH